MIIDRIENIGCYKGIGERLDRALAFIEKEAMGMEGGAVLELGDGIIARRLSYRPAPVGEGVAEAHRRNIDVMLMKEGREQIGYKPVGCLGNIVQEYSEEKDALLAKEEDITMLPFAQGCFAVFFPQDAHMPGIACCGDGEVERVVVKVPV